MVAIHRGRVAALLLVVATLTGCGSTSAPGQLPATVVAPAEVRDTLAPAGVLRIAVYSGSPTSLVRHAGTGEARGLTVDIGHEMARRLGVPAQLVEFERVEQVINELRSGRVDMTITNATPARAAFVQFTKPLVLLELGYLVPAGSPVSSVDDVDRPGMRVGVSQGSSSQAALGKAFRHATLVPASSLAVAGQMLADRSIDAFATNKGILFVLADGLEGARVLNGRWGTESLAIAVPLNRDRGLGWLQSFAASARQHGDVQRAAERAGLRGLAPS